LQAAKIMRRFFYEAPSIKQNGGCIDRCKMKEGFCKCNCNIQVQVQVFNFNRLRYFKHAVYYMYLLYLNC
jgi:hypothetical protein